MKPLPVSRAGLRDHLGVVARERAGALEVDERLAFVAGRQRRVVRVLLVGQRLIAKRLVMRGSVMAQQSRATSSVTSLPGSTCAPGRGRTSQTFGSPGRIGSRKPPAFSSSTVRPS